MAKKRDLRGELRTHFVGEGLRFGQPPEAIERAYKKLIGPRRYEDWLKVTDAMHAHKHGIEPVYASLATAEEINLIFSPQAAIALEIGAAISLRLLARSKPPARILEMGCSSGAFTSWLKHLYPEAEVIGIDRQANFIEAARSANPELTFLQGDYSTGEGIPGAGLADTIISILGIDLPYDKQPNPLTTNPQEFPGYKKSYEYCLPILHSWRKSACDGATLIAGLRIGSVETFLGFADAATDAGWSMDLTEPEKIQVAEQGQKERLPIFTLLAKTRVRVDRDELMGVWLTDQLPFPPGTDGDAARALYVLLGTKTPLRTDDRSYNGGHRARSEVGTVGPYAYVFSLASTGYASLLLRPRHELPSLEPFHGSTL